MCSEKWQGGSSNSVKIGFLYLYWFVLLRPVSTCSDTLDLRTQFLDGMKSYWGGVVDGINFGL